ncbi:MAG TPA: hypothetical protein VIW03_15225 [Anaeromyxobacter sp.]
MRRLALALAALAIPLVARADPPRAEGRIDTDEGHVEILGHAVRVGERVELPEGFIRVEEKGTEDEQVGSFTVVPAETFAAAAVAAPADDAAEGEPAARPEEAPACRAERDAYLAELWKQSGIEVTAPSALLEGLEGGARGPETGYYWFTLATDAFRPLAWSSDLRARADALARCVRGR